MTEPTAFLFPGQGSLPEVLPEGGVAASLVERAEARGIALPALWIRGDREALRRTEHAQPLIFISSVVQATALAEAGIVPDAVAGHSLGEYAALVSAGVLTAEEGLDLVIDRGQAMAPVQGGMAAILKLPLAEVERICHQVPDASVANINGDHQIVVSGTSAAVDAVATEARRQGGRAVPLDVSGPFHSPLMSGAAERFASALEAVSFRDPLIPIVSAVTGTVEGCGRRLRDLMTDQMLACVHWCDVMRTLEARGIVRAIETGPGTVLARLGVRITPAMRFMSSEEVLRG
jgi:[acyl-carrier-protein] S-malonyltransferase